MRLIWKLKEKLGVKNQAMKCRKVRESETSDVGGWEDVTMGDDACGEMMSPNKAVGP
jgi:hypothetical protein